jgi:3-deoxy-D-manno-octulosonic-acid transferase
MAPRHVERAPEIETVIARYGLSCVRRSQMSNKNISSAQHHPPRVIVLDSRGELPYVYRLGFVGFVGGTLVPVGGHNLLEPAQWGRPVIFGPYIDHFRDIAHQFLQAGAAVQVHQPKDLVTHLLHLLEHPAEAEQMGRQALSVVQQNRGVVKENLRLIGQLPIRQHDSLGPVSPSVASSVKAQIS